MPFRTEISPPPKTKDDSLVHYPNIFLQKKTTVINLRPKARLIAPIYQEDGQK